MGNYRQHLTFAWLLGAAYSVGAYLLAGLDWLYGSFAILFATIGGLLPDLDSPSGVELKGFTGLLGVLGALAVWYEVGRIDPPPVFELHLWSMVVTFLLIRHGLRRIMSRLTVHRGISHSFPTLAVWAELTYLHYPAESHFVRLMMACAVGLGFFSHLFLDEICSVDLKGARLNKAFGTAMKFWAPSIGSTLLMYGLLSFLTYQVIQKWPDDSTPGITRIKAAINRSTWPAGWPKPRWLDGILRTPAESGTRPETPSEANERIEGRLPRPILRPERTPISELDRSSRRPEAGAKPAPASVPERRIRFRRVRPS